jgi:hypothetical protein
MSEAVWKHICATYSPLVSLIKLRLDKLNASEEHGAESREADGGERNEASGREFEIYPFTWRDTYRRYHLASRIATGPTWSAASQSADYLVGVQVHKNGIELVTSLTEIPARIITRHERFMAEEEVDNDTVLAYIPISLTNEELSYTLISVTLVRKRDGKILMLPTLEDVGYNSNDREMQRFNSPLMHGCPRGREVHEINVVAMSFAVDDNKKLVQLHKLSEHGRQMHRNNTVQVTFYDGYLTSSIYERGDKKSEELGKPSYMRTGELVSTLPEFLEVIESSEWAWRWV